MKSFAFVRVLTFSGLAAAMLAQQPSPAPANPSPGTPAPPTLAPVTAPDTNVGPDTVVLTIGAQTLTRAQFELLLSALAEGGHPAKTAAEKRKVAEQFADLETMAQEARKRKLDERAEAKQMMQIESDSYLANSLAKKIQDDTHFTDLDLRSYYDGNKNEFEEAKGAHILIRFKGSKVPLKPNEKDLTEAEALAKAQDIRKQILGGADFAALAKAESDDVQTGAKGGDLGTFKRGQMVAPFDQAAFSLPVGEVSEPVKTQFGFHIIKVTSRDAKTFDEAKPQIEKELKPKLTREALDQVKAHTAVTLNESYFGGQPTSNGPQTLPTPTPAK
jgi:peptidyl-prolyl cis-trans isomerase C